ncbi:type II toxin-antitoxin system RelE/ParE family toxin [Desulfovibrio sp. OttesenSCG-928-I05]|nr:type II toxin-antitoxin system RelE/ParE family toxin [Desulfovibrio sp. OttesenSCG-928-I05]
MDLAFSTPKLKKICNEEMEMIRAYGKNRAKKLQTRLSDLEAATCLSDISHRPPPRRHELEGDKKGIFSVDLIHPWRLLFTPNHNPIPLKPDGGIDLSLVTSILIIAIEDTH